MAYQNIQVSREGQIVTITVNRPKALNALNSATLRELLQAVREAAESSHALILTGDMVDAKQALEIGLVNAVLPRGELMAHCRKVAEKIATRGPLAVARAKRLVERGYDIPLRAANRQEAETFALLFDTQDRAEGMRAFLEKRPAKFVGK